MKVEEVNKKLLEDLNNQILSTANKQKNVNIVSYMKNCYNVNIGCQITNYYISKNYDEEMLKEKVLEIINQHNIVKEPKQGFLKITYLNSLKILKELQKKLKLSWGYGYKDDVKGKDRNKVRDTKKIQAFVEEN